MVEGIGEELQKLPPEKLWASLEKQNPLDEAKLKDSLRLTLEGMGLGADVIEPLLKLNAQDLISGFKKLAELLATNGKSANKMGEKELQTLLKHFGVKELKGQQATSLNKIMDKLKGPLSLGTLSIAVTGAYLNPPETPAEKATYIKNISEGLSNTKDIARLFGITDEFMDLNKMFLTKNIALPALDMLGPFADMLSSVMSYMNTMEAAIAGKEKQAIAHGVAAGASAISAGVGIGVIVMGSSGPLAPAVGAAMFVVGTGAYLAEMTFDLQDREKYLEELGIANNKPITHWHAFTKWFEDE